MDTPYIRIKFKPIIKTNPQSNSNYCLEIVPTVTSIENINNVVLKDSQDSIEYVIPMTYKIVIKKQEPKDLIKVYHSCVDLLTSSLFSSSFDAGDVPRHLSENFTLSKVNSDLTKCITLPTFDIKVQTKNNILIDSKIEETTNHKLIQVFNSNSTQNVDRSSNVEAANTEINNQRVNQDNNKFTVNSETNTDNAEFEDHRTLNPSTVSTNSCDITNIRKLHKTHLCNVNIIDENLQKNCITKINSDLITYAMHCLQPLEFRNCRNLNTKYNNQWNINYDSNVFYKKNYNNIGTSVRIYPEERVATFRRNMEKDVLPLKVVLNDIINKCTKLGIYDLIIKNKSFNHNIHGFTKYCREQKENANKQYNRVVYSIVFDE